MIDKPYISVIIPIKNGGDIFKKVLLKVLDQKTERPFEVVLVDSGSTDDTLSFINKVQKEYKNIVLKMIHPSEFGHGKTRNLGASISHGDIFVFITQDALPYDEHWLKNLTDCFKLDEDVVGVFGKHIPYDDCDIFEKYNINTHFNNFGDQLTIYEMIDKERYKVEEGYRHLLCFYSDNSSAMRRSIWESDPYPDVDFAEDQLWAKGIIEKGLKKAYAPDAVVYHSHNYTFWQQFNRYYDEYKGLYKIYGFIPVKNVLLIPLHIIKHFVNDVKYLQTCAGLTKKEKIYWAKYSFKKNTVRYIAGYLGVRGHKYTFINNVFSRE